MSESGRPAGPGSISAPIGFDFSGQVAWVTGASRGLGRAVATAFAASGATVVLTARSVDSLREVEAEIRENGHECVALPGSVSDPEDVRKIAAGIGNRYDRLDVLVNNAGVSMLSPADRIDEEQWRTVAGVNLDGAFRCCRDAYSLLARSDASSIVNVSSVHGVVAGPKVAAYAASKGGLEMLTRSLAAEWAEDGIRVNSIAPGYIQTEMTAAILEHPDWSEALLSRIPLGRFADVSDIVPAALFLASRSAGYITGTTLVVDGGWVAA